MKTVLVTGGTVRLGQAIAAHLAAHGWRVLTSSHQPDASADCVADLSAADAPVRLFAAAARLAGGRLDALVNNAALYTGDAVRLTAVNTRAPQELMRLMAQHGGAVVNILDTAVLGDAPSSVSAYLAGKRELMDFTRRAAVDFAPNLRVNAVAPGPVLAPTAVREKAGRLLVARPQPEEVAEAVRFLLETPSVTGTVIPVDGGQHLLRGGGAA